MRKIIYACTALVMLLMLWACAEREAGKWQEGEKDRFNVILYFKDKEGKYLIPESREISIMEASVEESVIRELLKGPLSGRLQSIIPDGLKLIGVKVKGSTAYVDFNRVFKNSYSKSSLLVGSLVNTITEFPNINKVCFMIEGKVFSEQLSRMRNFFKRDNLNPSQVIERQMTYEKIGDWLNAYILMADREGDKYRKYFDDYIREMEEIRHEGLMDAGFEVGEYFVVDEARARVRVNFLTREDDGKFIKGPDVFFNTVKVDGYWRADWLAGGE